jgi:hypothetical protein
MKHVNRNYLYQTWLSLILYKVNHYILIISCIIRHFFIASRGQEAVNIKIIERNINSISKLPKIPKRAPNHEHQQQHISVEVFKSTMYVYITFYLKFEINFM